MEAHSTETTVDQSLVGGYSVASEVGEVPYSSVVENSPESLAGVDPSSMVEQENLAEDELVLNFDGIVVEGLHAVAEEDAVTPAGVVAIAGFAV